MLVDKPAGPTSHDVVAAVRRLTGERRVGHAGTLDPFATGLLPVLVGRCTRLAPWLVGLDKRYDGTLRLGQRTTTDDATGDMLAEGPVTVSDADLAAGMAALCGQIEQVPPAFSAKKVDGQPAYRRARRGTPVRLEPRTVEVHAFDLVEREGPDVRFSAHVGSGTYIRALARDLGAQLGCGAHLTALRRTQVGSWHVRDAHAPDDLGPEHILPASAAVPHLPHRALTLDEAVAVRHGRPVPDGDGEGPFALLADGELLAVAVRDGDVLKPRVVLAA